MRILESTGLMIIGMVVLFIVAWLITWSACAVDDVVSGKLSEPDVWRLDPKSPASASICSAAPEPYGTALQVEYHFIGKPDERVLMTGPALTVPETHVLASFLVHGEGSAHMLVFFIIDASGERHSYERIPINWSGWKQVNIYLLKRFWAHWGGDGNKKVDFPLRGAGFVVWRNDTVLQFQGRLYFADLRFRTRDQVALENVQNIEALWTQLGQEVPGVSDPLVRQHVEKLAIQGLAEAGRIHEAIEQGTTEIDSAWKQIEALERRHRFARAWLATCKLAGSLDARPSLPPLIVVIASVLEKVQPDELPTQTEHILRLEAARSEWESAQVVIAAMDEPLRKVSINFEPLHHESGWTIPSDALAWNPVGYVEDRQGMAEHYEAKLWPDPLLPPESVSVPAFTCQPFWLTVKVPKDAKPGEYTGQVELLLDGEPKASVKVTLRVFDFALPAKCHLKTAFGLNTHEVAEFYGRDDLTDDEYLRWVRFLLDRRIHGDRLVGSYHSSQKSEKCMKPNPWAVISSQLQRFDLLWCARITNKLLAEKPGDRQKAEQVFLDRLSAIVEQLRQRGVLERTYLYTYDELHIDNYDKALPFLDACRRVAPSLKVMLTFYKDDPVDCLQPYVDVWCPHFRWVAANWDTVRALQRSGVEVWWYFTQGDFPLPNITVSAPALSHRIMFWQTFHFGFTGILHWETCSWAPNWRTKPQWPLSNWLAYRIARGRYVYHGNGYLLYPGPEVTPLSSIRLETLRDGAEDYEYLWLLRERLRMEQIPSDLRPRATELLDLSDLIHDVMRYETDPSRFMQRRREIAELLESTSAK